MKLGLAEKEPPRPPAILVLGEGSLCTQIQDDLNDLGLNTVSLADLPLSVEDRAVPRLIDPDAHLRFQKIFRAFRSLERNHNHEHAWIHPGVTVWSERAEFEGWAKMAGMVTLSSPAKSLQLFWGTLQLLKAAEQVGVPTLIMSDEPITSIREIEASMKRLSQEGRAKLPFILKSAYRVRGGFASRVIRNIEELHEWVPIWMNHIQEHSGESLLFIERYLESARCYVQPYARLKTGETEFFPIVDGSLMVEGKNWIEVCPAQNVDEELQEKVQDYSKRILDHTDFVGVGNLVFLTNGVEIYFIEGLARLNFGYRLWETVARTKALQWQLHALTPGFLVVPPASRAKLSLASPVVGLHLKLYAEDTGLKIPHPGLVEEISTQTEWSDGANEAQLSWDVELHQNVNWKATGALGQVTVFSTNWRSVLKTARKALKEIWISGGIQTNERFLFELLSHPWVEESMFYTGFVDEEFIPKQIPESTWLNLLPALLLEVSTPLNENESWLWMNHRLARVESSGVQWIERNEFFENGKLGLKGKLQLDAEQVRVCVFPLTRARFVIRIRNWFFSVRRSEKGKPLQLMALTSGRVHSVFFKEGSLIEPKQCVLIIESHQTFITHRLPIPVTLKTLKVKGEDEVMVGQVLAELERVTEISNQKKED